MRRVSVIVPVYNVEAYLAQCLDSLLSQTERDIEVICVDDGSTDGSAAILSQYASRDTRVRIVRMQNCGAGVARNVGIEQACGDYLFFCDPDDWCEPDMLLDMADAADRMAADVVVSEFYAELACNFGDSKSKRVRFSAHASALPEVFSRRDDSDRLFGDFHPMVWNKLFRRAFLRAIGLRFQEIRRVNDMYFAFCALARADRICRLTAAYYHYRQNIRGSLQATLQKSPRDFISALTAIRNELERTQLFVALRKSFVNAAFGVCWENLYRMSDPRLAEDLFVHLRRNTLQSLGLATLVEADFNDRWLYERYRELLEAKDFADYTWKMTLICREGQMGLSKDCPFGILQGEVDAFANKIITRIERSMAQHTEEMQQHKEQALREVSERLARTNGFLNEILWELRESARYRNRGWVRNFVLGIPLVGRVARKGFRVVKSVRQGGVRSLWRGGMPLCDIRIKDIIAKEMSRRTYAGVYVIPTIPWDVPIFQRPQQMAIAMSRKGYLVIYLEYPSAAKPHGTIVHPIPGVVVVTVNAEEHMPSLDGVENAIISVYSTTFMRCRPDTRFFSRTFIESNRVVYEYIDHFDEKISGPEVVELRQFLDDLVTKKMPVTYLASARQLQKELADCTKSEVLYVANGVDQRHFSEENADKIGHVVRLPECLVSARPKIGYFGALAPWLDYGLIREVTAAHPEWDFIFIGPDYNGGSESLPNTATNCHWIGPVPYAELPAYAARFDVAILPFQSGDLAKSTSPLKLFEYFALGKPVVVTEDMMECTAFPEVFSGADASSFSHALERALEKRADSDFRRRMRQLAEENTWDARAQALIDGVSLTKEKEGGE